MLCILPLSALLTIKAIQTTQLAIRESDVFCMVISSQPSYHFLPDECAIGPQKSKSAQPICILLGSIQNSLECGCPICGFSKKCTITAALGTEIPGHRPEVQVEATAVTPKQLRQMGSLGQIQCDVVANAANKRGGVSGQVCRGPFNKSGWL